MEKKKLKRKDVVYDDDTSDSSSDEEQVRSSFNRVLRIKSNSRRSKDFTIL